MRRLRLWWYTRKLRKTMEEALVAGIYRNPNLPAGVKINRRRIRREVRAFLKEHLK